MILFFLQTKKLEVKKKGAKLILHMKSWRAVLWRRIQRWGKKKCDSITLHSVVVIVIITSGKGSCTSVNNE